MYQNYLAQGNNITWVQGIEGAKGFQMVPGANIVLMDSENEGVFYIKTCDNLGMCNLRTFNFTEVKATSKADFITRDEFYKAMEELKNERFIQQHNRPNESEKYAGKSTNQNDNGYGKK